MQSIKTRYTWNASFINLERIHCNEKKKSLSGFKRTLVIENLLHNLKNSHSHIHCILYIVIYIDHFLLKITLCDITHTLQ